MITKIGIVAGEIWQLLDNKGNMSAKEINSELDRSQLLIFMSLGWLSREGHILLEESEGNDFNVTLRKKETKQAEK